MFLFIMKNFPEVYDYCYSNKNPEFIAFLHNGPDSFKKFYVLQNISIVFFYFK
jgi:hypothetical protein